MGNIDSTLQSRFSYQQILVVSYRNLRDTKVSQISRTFLADLNNVLVRMVLILSLISNSSSIFYKSLGDCSKHTSCTWYHSHSHVSLFFKFSGKVQVFANFFASFYFPLGRQNHFDGKSFIFLVD